MAFPIIYILCSNKTNMRGNGLTFYDLSYVQSNAQSRRIKLSKFPQSCFHSVLEKGIVKNSSSRHFQRVFKRFHDVQMKIKTFLESTNLWWSLAGRYVILLKQFTMSCKNKYFYNYCTKSSSALYYFIILIVGIF